MINSFQKHKVIQPLLRLSISFLTLNYEAELSIQEAEANGVYETTNTWNIYNILNFCMN